MKTVNFNDIHQINSLIRQRDPSPFIIKNIPDQFIKQFDDNELLSNLHDASCLVKDILLEKQVRMNFSVFFEKLKEQYSQNNHNKRYTLQMGNIVSKGIFVREKNPPFHKLLSYIQINPLFTLVKNKLLEANLWIDSGGNITRLHFDPVDNFLMLLEGVKEIYLVAKGDTKYIYPSKKSPIHSQVDIVNIDFNKFPLAKNAVIQKVTLSAGESLFIPAGYWHQVISEGWNKAINLWWRIPLARKIQTPMIHFYKKEILSRIMFKGTCVPHTVEKDEINEFSKY